LKFWRRDGPDLKKQIEELEKKLQERGHLSKIRNETVIKKGEATVGGNVSKLERQNCAKEEVANLHDHTSHLEGKLKESDCDKEHLEATQGGQIKEMCAQIDLVRCEANQEKFKCVWRWRKLL
jgi:hypothetical protein